MPRRRWKLFFAVLRGDIMSKMLLTCTDHAFLSLDGDCLRLIT
jgi:hypothetical protein